MYKRQEKEIVEEDAQGDQPDKVEARREPDWQEMMRLLVEKIDNVKESMREDNQRHHEKLMKTVNEGFRKSEETMDSGLKNMTETCLLYTSVRA